MIFISHSSKNAKLANKLVEVLEANGIKCWIAPRDIDPGRPYAECIIDGINSAEKFLFIYTKDSVESQQVQKEVDRAVNLNLPMLTLKIEDVPPTKAMEYYLCDTHWLVAIGQKPKEYIKDLYKSLKKLKPAVDTTRVNQMHALAKSKRLSTFKLIGIGSFLIIFLLIGLYGFSFTTPGVKFLRILNAPSQRLLTYDELDNLDLYADEYYAMIEKIYAQRGYRHGSIYQPERNRYVDSWWFRPLSEAEEASGGYAVGTNSSASEVENMLKDKNRLTDIDYKNIRLIEIMINEAHYANRVEQNKPKLLIHLANDFDIDTEEYKKAYILNRYDLLVTFQDYVYVNNLVALTLTTEDDRNYTGVNINEYLQEKIVDHIVIIKPGHGKEETITLKAPANYREMFLSTLSSSQENWNLEFIPASYQDNDNIKMFEVTIGGFNKYNRMPFVHKDEPFYALIDILSDFIRQIGMGYDDSSFEKIEQDDLSIIRGQGYSEGKAVDSP